MNRNTTILALLGLSALASSAQWVNFAEPGSPRLPDGKLNLKAPAPKTADGKPDLTGVWAPEPTPTAELRRLFRGSIQEGELELLPPGMSIELLNKYGLDLLVDFDFRAGFKPDEAPSALLREEGLDAQARVVQEFIVNSPANPCNMEAVGWPQVGLLSEPFKIVQAPQETVILYELGNLHRQIFSDGRTFPPTFDLPAYLGYSVGRWEGDTFVVETRGFKNETLLDISGHPRSDAMHVTERFRRRDYGHLEVEMTFDDPKFYTRSWTIRVPHQLVANNDIFEMFCENERDMEHTQ